MASSAYPNWNRWLLLNRDFHDPDLFLDEDVYDHLDDEDNQPEDRLNDLPYDDCYR